MNKMYSFTKEETIQALRVCSKGGVTSECRSCPYKVLDGNCVSVLLRNALSLLEKDDYYIEKLYGSDVY